MTKSIIVQGRSAQHRSALFVVSTSQRRGAEVFAADLSAALSGHDIAANVVALDGETNLERIALRSLGTGRKAPRTWRNLASAISDHDVVVSNGGTTLLPVALTASVVRKPFVYRNIGDPAAWGDVRFAQQRLGWPLRRAAAIAALYPNAATELIHRYKLDPSRVATIPNAADAERFTVTTSHARAVARQKLEIDERRLWVLYIGNLSEEKQPLAAIEAVKSNNRLGLLIAGEGPLADECARRSQSALAGSIQLLGQVSDVVPLYAASDVVVIPSRTEGIPGVAIEAAMTGLGVVATDVGGMSHVVTKESGTLVSSTDPQTLAAALVEAAKNRETLGASGARYCRENFSMDAVSVQWADLITTVAASTQTR